MVAVPLVGAARPSSIRSVVVLPAPLGPRKPVTRPGPTSKLKPSTAVTAPYRLVRWSTLIMWAVLSGRAVTPVDRYPTKVARPGVGWHQRSRQSASPVTGRRGLWAATTTADYHARYGGLGAPRAGEPAAARAGARVRGHRPVAGRSPWR